MEGNVGVHGLKGQFGEEICSEFMIFFDPKSEGNLADETEFS